MTSKLMNVTSVCVYVKDMQLRYFILCIYVDDMLIFGSDDKMIRFTKNMLNSKFDIKRLRTC